MIRMKNKGNCWTLAPLMVVLLVSISCIYMKMNPPSDVNKAFLSGNNSCYLATASNILAGAGYGTGSSLQARADSIYSQMISHFGTANGGWTDTAISWWLGSANNTWANNPYSLVTVYGNKDKIPWANANGPRDLGTYLRSCSFIGVSISWPAVTGGYGGHAITGWGDNGRNNDNALNYNPSQLRLTDSDDNDSSGPTHVYTYDSYTNPNPGGDNNGNGWYINYSTPHPFIKHIVTLSPVKNAQGVPLMQRVLGTYKLYQTAPTRATDLHYKVGTDVEILSYKTELDWTGTAALSPIIVESGTPREELAVDWDLKTTPVGQNNTVTISTEFIERYWNSIYYKDIYFTYPDGSTFTRFPGVSWKMETPGIENADRIENVTGGYVVGSFDVINPNIPPERQLIAQYRFSHQYSYTQNPEQHRFTIQGERGFVVVNFRFGHSYGKLDLRALWKFENWMTSLPQQRISLDEKAAEIVIDWKGRLPYPKGEVIPDWLYKQKKIIKR